MNETVLSVSLEKELLEKIDKMAEKEEKNRSESIEDAEKTKTERIKKWKRLSAYGQSMGRKYGITEEVIAEEIRLYREEQNAKNK
jgi:metal-responsive CopG/Arc/MetJ family transcriptional regulator